MRIWAHTLVKNEERYIWYSVMSLINQVDKILIWDTGSTDNTVNIINIIAKKYPKKIEFNQVGSVDPDGFTKVRQKMLTKTNADWLIMLDGDEVWWDEKIKETISLIREKGDNLDTVVSRYYNVVGDIFHHQEEAAGRYEIDRRRGHLTVRVVRRSIPGLHFAKPHGIQALFDELGVPVQNRPIDKREYVDGCSYLHFTHMVRSENLEKDQVVMKRKKKMKYELGIPFPLDFYYPEVFFRPRPLYILSPWNKMSFNFYIKALTQTPLRKLKRRFVKGKSGY